MLWTHSDSGNAPYVFATDRAGRALACLAVTGATNVDWEDIAEGPGVAGPALYIGDFGDNNRVRTDLAVYRVPEPDVATAPIYPAVGSTPSADRIPFSYPDGAHYDAETLLVNPVTGVAFVGTKETSGASRVFQFPGPLQTLPKGVPVTLTQVAAVQFTGLLSFDRTATSGDLSADGTTVVIRTYTAVHEWPINPGQSVPAALSSNLRQSYALPLTQGEGICYRPDGKTCLITAEATSCPLGELRIR